MEAISTVIMLFSLPHLELSVDTLVVMPGQGETLRVKQAIQEWEKGSAKHLLIAGIYDKEKTFVALDIKELQKNFGLKRVEGVHTAIHASNTKEQAEWIVRKVQETHSKSVALFNAPYHMLRAYSTVLKAFIVHKVPRIPLIPVPVSISPDKRIPEVGINAWDMIPGEMERIRIYQEKGDVATYSELKDYLSWVWSIYGKT